jgi:hypothetical protein
MKRGTKEFYEVQASFEKLVDNGFFGYISGDLTKDNFNSVTFYANGEVNTAFSFLWKAMMQLDVSTNNT